MCGIAGLALRPPANRRLPRCWRRWPPPWPIAVRDGAGSFIAEDAALVHTRLAIIDLATGGQPLHAGPLTLIANGEIYNYRELREALPVAYGTDSDCEPPLQSVLPPRRRLRRAPCAAMYAIAIHDAAFHTVTLSRDPFGIKPLYIAPDRIRPGLCLGAAGPARRRPGPPRTRPGAAQRVAQPAIHHRYAQHFHRHRAGWRPAKPSPSAAARSPTAPVCRPGKPPAPTAAERSGGAGRARRRAGKRRRPAPAGRRALRHVSSPAASTAPPSWR